MLAKVTYTGKSKSYYTCGMEFRRGRARDVRNPADVAYLKVQADFNVRIVEKATREPVKSEKASDKGGVIIHTLASNLGVDNAILIEALEEMGVTGKKHASKITDEQAEELTTFILEKQDSEEE